MKRLAFLVAALVGLPLSASADPENVTIEVYGDRYLGPDRYERDDRVRGDRYRGDRFRGRDLRGRWVPIASGNDARVGRQYLDVNMRGRFDKLRVEADHGAPVIRRMVVEYGNGRREVVRINAQLTRGRGQVIDLPRERRISRIVVITDPRSRGAYTIYGT